MGEYLLLFVLLFGRVSMLITFVLRAAEGMKVENTIGCRQAQLQRKCVIRSPIGLDR